MSARASRAEGDSLVDHEHPFVGEDRDVIDGGVDSLAGVLRGSLDDGRLARAATHSRGGDLFRAERFEAFARAPVLDGVVQRVGREVRAMHLDGRQTVEGVCHVGPGDLQRLVERLPHDELGDHAGGGDGRAATEGLELDVVDAVVLHADVHLHEVAADGVADAAHGHVIALERAHVAGVPKVVESLLGVLR